MNHIVGFSGGIASSVVGGTRSLELKTVNDWVYVVDESGRNLARFEQLSEAVEAIRLVKKVLSENVVQKENLS